MESKFDITFDGNKKVSAGTAGNTGKHINLAQVKLYMAINKEDRVLN